MEYLKTSENKAKFFAQYWGQDCLRLKSSIDYLEDKENLIAKDYVSHLELKPLEIIRDNEAQRMGFRDALEFLHLGNHHSYKDELRLMGFAVEWNGISVEQQIEFEWVKLKN